MIRSRKKKRRKIQETNLFASFEVFVECLSHSGIMLSATEALRLHRRLKECAWPTGIVSQVTTVAQVPLIAPVNIETQPVVTSALGNPPEERDSAGIAWDASRHASSKARNSDGTWRARRNVQGQTQEAPTTPEPTLDLPEPSQTVQDRQNQANLILGKLQANQAHEAPAAPAASAPSGQESHDTPVAAGAVAFSEWLVDHEGDGIGDDPIDDPEMWAHAYVRARDETAPESLILFDANNYNNLVRATAASPEVARIVAPAPTLPMDMPVDPLFATAPKVASHTPETLAKSMILDMEAMGSIASMDAWKASEPGKRDWMLIEKSDAWLFSGLIAAEKMERARISAAARGPEVAPSVYEMDRLTTEFMERINACKTRNDITGLGEVQENVNVSTMLARHAPDLWRTMRRAVMARQAALAGDR